MRSKTLSSGNLVRQLIAAAETIITAMDKFEHKEILLSFGLEYELQNWLNQGWKVESEQEQKLSRMTSYLLRRPL